MVFFTGHDVKRNVGALRFFYHIQQIFDQALKNIDVPGQPDVIHTLGITASQSGSHAAGQEAGCHLSFLDG